MDYSNLLDEYGVRLNVIGRVELFPKSVQRAIWQAETKTRHNNRYVCIVHRVCIFKYIF